MKGSEGVRSLSFVGGKWKMGPKVSPSLPKTDQWVFLSIPLVTQTPSGTKLLFFASGGGGSGAGKKDSNPIFVWID